MHYSYYIIKTAFAHASSSFATVKASVCIILDHTAPSLKHTLMFVGTAENIFTLRPYVLPVCPVFHAVVDADQLRCCKHRFYLPRYANASIPPAAVVMSVLMSLDVHPLLRLPACGKISGSRSAQARAGSGARECLISRQSHVRLFIASYCCIWSRALMLTGTSSHAHMLINVS